MSLVETITRLDENVSARFTEAVPEQYRVYPDLNQSDLSGKPLLYNLESVSQSITNLFSTERGERLFRPTVGSSLRSIIFKQVNEATAMQLRQLLINSIEEGDRRISIVRKDTKIVPAPEEDGYDVVIRYNVYGIPEQAFTYAGFLYTGE